MTDSERMRVAVAVRCAVWLAGRSVVRPAAGLVC